MNLPLHLVRLKLSCLAAIFGLLASAQPVVSTVPESGRSLPANSVDFIENKGQLRTGNSFSAGVHYYAATKGLKLYVTGEGLTYLFLKAAAKKGSVSTGEWERVDMRLQGASIKKDAVITEEPVAGTQNFFLSHCPDGVTDVHGFKKLTFKDVYPGIDWVLYNSSTKGFKYDFVVHPGADPANIRMAYSSLEPVELMAGGALKISTSFGSLNEEPPVSFFDSLPVKSSYRKLSVTRSGNAFVSTFGFNISDLAPLSKGKTLLIDPNLVWATFVGGFLDDYITSVTTDQAGNLLATGYTTSFDFPTQNGGYFQGTLEGFEDIIIMKFSPQGQLIWSTFYGGNNIFEERGNSVVTDNSGNVFVAGHTSSADFPLEQASGAFFQPSLAAGPGGASDAFFLKFDAQGTRIWATYYGGLDGQPEKVNSIATDNNGNLFATGVTTSSTFPVQFGGGYFQGAITPNFPAAFVLKFDNNGARLWSTFLGNVGTIGNALALDPNGDLFLAGTVGSSATLPIANPGGIGYFQNNSAGGSDAFICRFTNTGSLLWSTFVGGAGADEGYSLATDKTGNIFMSGIHASANFPFQNANTFFQPFQGASDAFVAKFNPNCQMVWCSSVGGTGIETMESYDNLAVDTCGNLFMSFQTTSGNSPRLLPCDGGYFSASPAGQIFLARFSNSGALTWGTQLGGDGIEHLSPVAVDKDNRYYAAGCWSFVNNANTYTTVTPGPGSYFTPFPPGNEDAFITRFDPSSGGTAPTFSYTNPLCTSTLNALPVRSSGFVTGGVYSSQAGLVLNPATGAITLSTSVGGTYTVTYTQPPCGCLPTTSLTTTVQVIPSFSLSVNSLSTCVGNPVTLTATPTVTDVLTYTWMPGGVVDNPFEVSPSVTTVYTVSASFGGCTVRRTTTVTVRSKLSAVTNFSYPVPLCNNSIEAAPVVPTGFSYGGIFSSGGEAVGLPLAPVDSASGVLKLKDLKEGTYLINYVFAASGCTTAGSYSTLVQVVSPARLQVPSNLTVVEGQSIPITVTGGQSYTWTPATGLSCTDCESPQASPRESITYCAGALVDGCYASACVAVEVVCFNTGDFSVPTAFTPNGDGNNDRYCLRGWSRCATDFQVRIFDRWGETVFESTDPDFCWDGTYKGALLNAGVYVFSINAVYNNDTPVSKSGNITLIR